MISHHGTRNAVRSLSDRQVPAGKESLLMKIRSVLLVVDGTTFMLSSPPELSITMKHSRLSGPSNKLVLDFALIPVTLNPALESDESIIVLVFMEMELLCWPLTRMVKNMLSLWTGPSRDLRDLPITNPAIVSHTLVQGVKLALHFRNTFVEKL